MWEDRKQNSFCSLTAHFIGEDFKLDRVTPAIKYFGIARHRSVNIAAALTEEIEKVKGDAGIYIVLVSDSTSNMVKTRELLKEKKVIDMEIGCSLHKIQNDIKDAIKATAGVKKTMAKAKKLIKFIRKSNPAANRLKTACSKSGHRHKRLKSCIDIRWNSEYDAFERLLYHQECLEDMDRSRDLDKISSQVLNRNDWRILQAVVEILKPVKISTKILETESEPSINRVAECLYDLDEGLKAKIENTETPSWARALAKNLKKSLVKRFPSYGLTERLFGYGNFLDPHLKGIHLEKEKLMNAVTSSMKGMICKFDVPQEKEDENKNKPVDIEEENLSATEKLLKKKRDPLSNVFDEEESAGASAAKKEIDVYMKLPLCTRKDDVLQWWADHSNILPRLSILARWILSVPAGTASSEHLFSIGGLFDTIRRGNMNTETFELLTLLKTNKKALDKFGVDVHGDSCEEDSHDENDNNEEGDAEMEEEELLNCDDERNDSSSEEEYDSEEEGERDSGEEEGGKDSAEEEGDKDSAEEEGDKAEEEEDMSTD